MARLRDGPEPRIQRIVGNRRKKEPAQDHRLAADDVRQPTEEDECRGPDDEPESHDEGTGERVHLGNRLQVEQRPELAAVPDHALAQYHNGCDHHVFEIGGIEEGLAPWIFARLPLGLDLRVDRRLLEIGPHVHGDEHQQEGEQERDAPRPVVEHGLAEVAAHGDDHDERQDDSKRRRSLQPAGIISAPVFRHVLRDIGDCAAV